MAYIVVDCSFGCALIGNIKIVGTVMSPMDSGGGKWCVTNTLVLQIISQLLASVIVKSQYSALHDVP